MGNMNTQNALGNMGNTLNFNEEIKKCKTPDDLFGENGLIKKFVKEALESMLQAEMEDHLGRKKHKRTEDNEPNYRNGICQKPIISSAGEMEIEVPRDREKVNLNP
jgi:transposase-like protein